MKIKVDYVIHKIIEVEVDYTNKDLREADNNKWPEITRQTYDKAYETIKKKEKTDNFTITEGWSEGFGTIFMED